MDFLFQRYVRVTIHLECLWFCFAKVIKAYLDKVKDHWNSYHIGHSRHDTVSGVPDVLFFLPEYSVATDRLISVEQAQVDEMDNEEMDNGQLPQHMEEYAEYFEYVMANKNCPTNVKEAFDLFQYFTHLQP